MKVKKFSGIIVFIAMIGVAMTACNNGTGGFVPEYAVGDTGPGGGIIFYVGTFTMTDTGTTAHYLEAAPEDISGYVVWQQFTNDIPGTAVTLGSGRKNTALIHAHADLTGAASACVAPYDAGGTKTDWFLPSKDELNELCEQQDLFGNFTTFNYWSSSQIDSNKAWVQWFVDGNPYDVVKTSNCYARAIRAF